MVDYYILPSFLRKIGMSLVEIQMLSLKCICFDKALEEANVTDLVKKLPLVDKNKRINAILADVEYPRNNMC